MVKQKKENNLEDLQKQIHNLEIRIDDIEKKINIKTKKLKSNRTLSAYQLYSKDIREKITKEVKKDDDNKTLNGKEINNLIMKKIGEHWKNINIKEKHKYEEKAKKLKLESIENKDN